MRCIYILFLFSTIPFAGARNSDTVSGAAIQQHYVANSDQQCDEFLRRTRDGMVSSLEKRIKSNRQVEECLWGGVSKKCHDLKNIHLKDLENYEKYRSEVLLSDITYDPLTGDFYSIKLKNGNLKNGLGKRLSSLSNSEKSATWKTFEKFHRDYVPKWWAKTDKKKFPNWQECVEQKNEKIVLESKHGRRTFVPKFKRPKRARLRQLSHEVRKSLGQQCESLRLYWLSAPYAVPMSYAIRKGSKKEVGSHKRKRNLEKQFSPYMYLLKGKISGLSKLDQLKVAARGYNRLNSESTKFLKWLKSRSHSQLDDLLALDVVKKKLGGQEFCKNYEKKTWGEFAKEIGLSMIPGYYAFEAALIGKPQNDQIFLSGFMGKEEWGKKKGELNQTIMRHGFGAVPLLLAENAVAARVMKAAGPLAKKIYNKTASRVDFGRTIGKAEKLLGRLPASKKKAVFSAHLVGRQIGANGKIIPRTKYSKAEIEKKLRILKRAGFTPQQAKVLARERVVGDMKDTKPGLFSKIFGKTETKILNKVPKKSNSGFKYDHNKPRYTWKTLSREDLPNAKVSHFPLTSKGKDFSEIVATVKQFSGAVCSSARVCRGSSHQLQELLINKGIQTDFVSSSSHSFLRIKNYFGQDKDLVIDPTWTQFVQRELDEFVPDKMFVGSLDDLYKVGDDLARVAREVDLPENGSQNAETLRNYYRNYRLDSN